MLQLKQWVEKFFCRTGTNSNNSQNHWFALPLLYSQRNKMYEVIYRVKFVFSMNIVLFIVQVYANLSIWDNPDEKVSVCIVAKFTIESSQVRLFETICFTSKCSIILKCYQWSQSWLELLYWIYRCTFYILAFWIRWLFSQFLGVSTQSIVTYTRIRYTIVNESTFELSI